MVAAEHEHPLGFEAQWRQGACPLGSLFAYVAPCFRRRLRVRVDDEAEPRQIQVMQRMVDMAAIRTQLSAERSYQNAERTLAVGVRTALALVAWRRPQPAV